MNVIINTRPSNAKPINSRLPVFALPLLKLTPCTLDEHERLSLQKLISGEVNLLVAVSVMAVRCLIDELGKHGIDHANQLIRLPTLVMAVGQATAQALMDFGFVVITPNVMSNEGMLALPQIQALGTRHTALICKGTDGRQVLYQGLLAQGVNVQCIDFYERLANDELPYHIDRLCQDLVQFDLPTLFIPISSELSLKTWHAHFERLSGYRCVYLPLGQRLSALTKAHFPHHLVMDIDRLDGDYLDQLISTITS